MTEIMKIFKKFICAVLIAVVAFALAGCGDSKTPGDDTQTNRLATPQNVRCTDEGLISWNAVEHADFYIVVLNGAKLKATNTNYKVGSVVNDFTYQIIADSSGDEYTQSAPTEVFTFKGKGVPIVPNPLLDTLTVSVTGNQLVGSGRSTKLTATVNFIDGNSNRNVTWSVVDGEEYGTVDEKGTFKAKTVTEDHDVTVRATSNDNSEKYAEIVICVACQPVLTEAMLSTVKDDVISFEGYMDIDLYTFEIYERYVKTVTLSGISTSMNGERWHASYVDSSTGYLASIDYKNNGGIAQQVALSLMNDEEYYPMTDDEGNEVSWADSGLYNNFKNLKVSDFTFDEEDWRYYYSGEDNGFIQKVLASSNPYEFSANRFGLIIEDGELLGIYAESNPDYAVVSGYKAIEKLYSYINCGAENVEVPVIEKFKHNPMTTAGTAIDHDALGAAIDNMRSYDNYKLEFKLSSHMAGGYKIEGYYETVIPGDYYFEPYSITVSNNSEIKTPKIGEQYGYHRLDENTYNSYNFDIETGKYLASRAYNGDMNNMRASFAFAPEIFTATAKATANGRDATVYYVDETMCTVASTMYCGVGNDAPLFGLFAMRYEILADYTPYVVVQDGKFIEVGWFYFLGDMYGEVRIYYSDLVTAKMPDSFVGFNGYVPRIPPSSWNDLTVIDQTVDGNEEEKNAYEFFTGLLGSEEAASSLPFFGTSELLGDTFGFALATYFSPGGTSRQVPCVILYYDVALDGDRSIDRIIKKTQEFLVRNGFTKNAYGEYEKDGVSVKPYDSSLDFWIYVWKTV